MEGVGDVYVARPEDFGDPSFVEGIEEAEKIELGECCFLAGEGDG